MPAPVTSQPSSTTYLITQVLSLVPDSLLPAVLTGAVALIASFIAAAISLWIARRYTGKQIQLLERAEYARLADSLVQTIFTFRNKPEVEKLRAAIRGDLKSRVDAALKANPQNPDTAAQTISSWLCNNDKGASERDVLNFLSRMNTVAWQILRMPKGAPAVSPVPSGERPTDRDAILEIIHENLILEWDALSPWIANIRRDDWWLIHLLELVVYAKERRSDLRESLKQRMSILRDAEAGWQKQPTGGGAP